jgi:EAL domain-containing protein (putative c-di-GMP-specific phosphodiesterase class I)
VELATGNIRKAEALVRWQHPQRGLVCPGEFIHIAEDTGVIIEIGDWVFREAAREVKRLRQIYHPDFQISVNRSPVQFHQDETHRQETWIELLQQLELPGQSIAIEITEGLLLDAATNVTDKLRAFGDVGVMVSLDDFGTGYSAMSSLNKFRIDYLKIDQSFVRNLESDADDMALCEAIIVMAHKLGLKVIAEGVETEAQRDFLKRAGCDYAQGYLFSRPVPADELEELLRAA